MHLTAAKLTIKNLFLKKGTHQNIIITLTVKILLIHNPMARIIDLKTHTDKRGNLTVIEKVIPFDIKRIFYIYGIDNSVRGGHRHYKTRQAAICLAGKCVINNNNGQKSETFILDTPSKCLIIEPNDWHTMEQFSKEAILMVLASEEFTPDDYIYEKYQ
jgi:dTDP-4-dehydrorhamnose 3,5-epimerase-like enzyme